MLLVLVVGCWLRSHRSKAGQTTWTWTDMTLNNLGTVDFPPLLNSWKGAETKEGKTTSQSEVASGLTE